MPSTPHSQVSFAGGELSPRLKGHTEADLYRIALGYCLNWQPVAHGSLLTRPGSLQVAKLYGGPKTRIIPFKIVGGQDYILELADRKMRIWKDGDSTNSVITGGSGGGEVIVVSTTELITNGDFSAAIAGWTQVSAIPNGVTYDAALGLMLVQRVLGHNDEGEVQQTIVVPQDCAGPLSFNLTIETLMHMNASGLEGTVPGGSHVLLRLGSTPGGEEVLAEQTLDDRLGGKLTFPGLVLAAGTYYLRFKTSSPANTTAYQVLCKARIDNVSLPGTVTGGAGGAVDQGWSLISPWLESELADVQYASETGNNRMVLVHRKHPPQVLKYSGEGNWSFGPALFAAPPNTWRDVFKNPAGTWVANGDWPSAVEIFQGRLWLAFSNVVWASRPGDLFDFTPEDDVDSTEIIQHIITHKSALMQRLATNGSIQWLKGRAALIVGTDLGEGAVTSQGPAVSPLDFQYIPQSAFGSSFVQSLDVGDQALYVSPDGRKVRAINYQRDAQGWVSKDITFVAEHITLSGIAELHFARDPDNTLVAKLATGDLACCTYDRGQSVVAWWRFQLAKDRTGTPGKVLSAAVSNGPAGSVLYAAVQRANGVFLEKFPMSESYPGRCYVDAAVVKTIPDSLALTGLDHLEAESVEVIIDGIVCPKQTVVNGSLTLPFAGDQAVVGLGYRPKGVTLPPVVVKSAVSAPSSQATNRRWVKLTLRLNNSCLPLVNGARHAPDRSPDDAMDEAVPLSTGDFVAAPYSDWGRGELVLESDKPLRCEILSLFGSLDVEEVS